MSHATAMIQLISQPIWAFGKAGFRAICHNVFPYHPWSSSTMTAALRLEFSLKAPHLIYTLTVPQPCKK